MAAALQATGRPIHYAICNWGEDQPWEWASVGHPPHLHDVVLRSRELF